MEEPDIYQCGSCSRQKPLSFFTGNEGQIYKMCLKCREKDARQRSRPEVIERKNAMNREKKYYQLYRERKRAAKAAAQATEAVVPATNAAIQDVAPDDDDDANVDVRNIPQHHAMVVASAAAIPDMETWKVIDDFPDFEVSNTGKVRNTATKRIRSTYTDPSRFEYITLNKNSRSMHSLVAKAFLPNPENKAHVIHKNNDRKDNRVENLEWLSVSEHKAHKRKQDLDARLIAPIASQDDTDIQDAFDAFTMSDGIAWKVIQEFPNYEVSNKGDVRNISTKRTLAPCSEPGGYAYVTLSKNSRSIHRLVAKAFLPNHAERDTVNHKNHNRQDNRVENLEWSSMSEQNRHKTHKGFKSTPDATADESEQWRPWPQDPIYQVSNRGRIKRGETFVMVYAEDRYHNVSIVKDNKRRTTLFHRIVAETWCPNWTDDCVINHIDGNKQNNFPENLECTTQSDNIRKAYATNEAMNARMRKVRQHLADGSFDTTHVSLREASRVSGMNDGSIAYACKHGTEHGGYLWQFADAVPDPVPTGAKECSNCRKRFPEDQFVGLRGKPVKMCPACRAKTSKGAERDNKKLEEETPEGTKRCSGHCRQVKSLTEFVSTINQTETKLCSSCREYQASRHKKK